MHKVPRSAGVAIGLALTVLLAGGGIAVAEQRQQAVAEAQTRAEAQAEAQARAVAERDRLRIAANRAAAAKQAAEWAAAAPARAAAEAAAAQARAGASKALMADPDYRADRRCEELEPRLENLPLIAEQSAEQLAMVKEWNGLCSIDAPRFADDAPASAPSAVAGGGSDAAQRLADVGNVLGYGPVSDPAGFASVMEMVCADVASGAKSWADIVAEDVANGAPDASAERMASHLSSDFCVGR